MPDIEKADKSDSMTDDEELDTKLVDDEVSEDPTTIDAPHGEPMDDSPIEFQSELPKKTSYTFIQLIGYGFKDPTFEELRQISNANMVIRCVIYFFLLLSWTIAAASVSQILFCVSGSCSGLNYLLAVGILGWLFITVVACMWFMLFIRHNKLLGVAYAWLGLVGDVFFVFFTLSSFSSGATISTVSNDGKMAASAAFMFLSFALFVLSTFHSKVIFENRNVLGKDELPNTTNETTEAHQEAFPTIGAVEV